MTKATTISTALKIPMALALALTVALLAVPTADAHTRDRGEHKEHREHDGHGRFEDADFVKAKRGQLLEEFGETRRDWLTIGFRGFVARTEDGELVGKWKVRLKNVANDEFDGSVFRSKNITDLNFFDGDDESCQAAVNFTAEGTFDGEEGYTLIFRAGDAGDTDHKDTARVEIYDPDGNLVYDSHADGEFSDESSCVGTARTGVDKGRLKISFD